MNDISMRARSKQKQRKISSGTCKDKTTTTLYNNRNNFKSLHSDVISSVPLSYKFVQRSKRLFHLLSVNQVHLLFEQGTEQEFSFIAVLKLCLVCSSFEFVPTLNSLCAKYFEQFLLNGSVNFPIEWK